MGSKLVVSFANPAKHYETHGIRPQSTGMNVAMVGGANAKLGLRGNGALASGLLAGRPGMNGSKTGFGGRLSPSQPSFANGQGQSQLFHLNVGVELTEICRCPVNLHVSLEADFGHAASGSFGGAGQLGAGGMGFNNDDMAARLQQQTMQMQQVRQTCLLLTCTLDLAHFCACLWYTR